MSYDYEPKTPFEGIVLNELENIRRDAHEARETAGRQDGRIRKVENDMANIKGKAAAWGGMVGLAVTVIKEWMFPHR